MIELAFLTEGASPTVSEAMAALVGRTVDLECTEGYPSGKVYALRVDDDGDLVVCELDAGGRPLSHSTWAIPQGDIRRITVPEPLRRR